MKGNPNLCQKCGIAVELRARRAHAQRCRPPRDPKPGDGAYVTGVGRGVVIDCTDWPVELLVLTSGLRLVYAPRQDVRVFRVKPSYVVADTPQF